MAHLTFKAVTRDQPAGVAKRQLAGALELRVADRAILRHSMFRISHPKAVVQSKHFSARIVQANRARFSITWVKRISMRKEAT